jgi:DNA-binding NarL/FixJ family response regulator
LLVDDTGETDLVNALQAGMRGYVFKRQSGSEMIDAVRAVLAGGLYLSPEVLRTLVPRLLSA